MSKTITNTRTIVPGFWTRLKLVLEECSESYEERLERRVRRLEAEVERLLSVHDPVGSRQEKSGQ